MISFIFIEAQEQLLPLAKRHKVKQMHHSYRVIKHSSFE